MIRGCVIFCLSMMTAVPGLAASLDACLLDALKSAQPSQTVADLQAACEKKQAVAKGDRDKADGMSITERRVSAERQAFSRDYTITTHRPNFLMPLTYDHNPNDAPFKAVGDDDSVDEIEAFLQVSFKFPLMRGLFDTETDFMFAYTSRAWWQVYNSDYSKPFRETNYEPELFLRHYGGPSVLGLDVVGWDFGYVHQSNGRTQLLSRSWDRIFGQAVLDVNDDLALALKAWYRLPEDDDENENPGMYRYLGYGHARLIYAPNGHTFTGMYRPGTEKQSVELTWSHPISEHLRIYTLYFNGYGDSLLDYDAKVERIGIGIAINDYLQSTH